MSAPATSARSTATADLDRAVGELHERARRFARLGPAAKAGLVRSCIPRVVEVAPAWSARGLKAKGLPATSAEEWLAGPLPTVRHLRLLAASLDAIASSGRPPLGTGTRSRADGRLEVDLFPVTGLDRALYRGTSAYALLQEGLDADAARARQAPFYAEADPEGGVCLVLGAGNASSIPAMDVLTKLFNEGQVCLLKINPVNEWVGPFVERALAPLVEAGFLRVVYGGAEVGRHLVGHPGIDAVHLTGSAQTHDALVWGPPGPEQDRRRAANDPVLAVPITSELGNVTPVAVVPHRYRPADLAFQARYLATMVANNASFNCISAKMLVTASGWPQREEFLDLVSGYLAGVPTRRAYYPGAAERYATLTEGREVRPLGAPAAGELPWGVIRGLDATATDDPLFVTEPFCSLLSETSVAGPDPVDFLAAATTFANDTLWGTLSAAIIVPPELERDPTVAQALDRSVTDLRYGNVAINHWPALNYALVSLPWGGHPSSTLQDVQSGLGWVHNSGMLGGLDKAVLRGGIRVRPTPPWFADHPSAGRAGADLVGLEADPSWARLPGLLRHLL
ncbi:aldehyde dehydrogenase family protein [uncultured Friedmanniella sp.]|uniref:aldehyde dehydrogenase family protein n=1 Tax=uncultured Friedmanniella sp. TaxID=335381 RepID=UPI0035CBAE7B